MAHCGDHLTVLIRPLHESCVREDYVAKVYHEAVKPTRLNHWGMDLEIKNRWRRCDSDIRLCPPRYAANGGTLCGPVGTSSWLTK